MDGLVKDVQFAFRMLLRTPMRSLIATLTFGLGAGSTAFIYLTTIAIGELPVALGASRSSMVGIATWDPLVYGLVVLTLTLTALLAAVVPALKALRVDPADALRAD